MIGGWRGACSQWECADSAAWSPLLSDHSVPRGWGQRYIHLLRLQWLWPCLLPGWADSGGRSDNVAMCHYFSSIAHQFPSGGPVLFTAFVSSAGPLECQEREVELGKRRKLFSVYDVHEEIGRWTCTLYWCDPTCLWALFRCDMIGNIALCLRGTFGVVKRVVHRRTCEVFAAKFLPLRSSTRTRSFQERDLLSRLAHPRVACLLDFFCTRRTLVLITEMYPLC